VGLTWVELRRFELLTSCMPFLEIPSEGVALGRVSARQSTVACLTVTGSACRVLGT